MTKNFPWTDGRNNGFFQDTSIAFQPVAPVKGNLMRKKAKQDTKSGGSGKTLGRKPYSIPNQGTTNGPPKSAGWMSLSRPYQANWQLRSRYIRQPE